MLCVSGLPQPTHTSKATQAHCSSFLVVVCNTRATRPTHSAQISHQELLFVLYAANMFSVPGIALTQTLIDKFWIRRLTLLMVLHQTSECQLLLVPWEGDLGVVLIWFSGFRRFLGGFQSSSAR